ncbi:MAG: GyrI-like domain-containing protein [Planctomycetes bacterium]|nr:GyrI-like domain-containing protein [Planctomycetota bacterium]
MLNVTIQRVEPIRVAGMRHIGPYPEAGPVFQKMFGWAGARGLFGPETRCLGVFHDNPRDVPAERLRSDACVEVGPEVTADPAAGVEIAEIAGGDYATTIFEGPYEDLETAYDYLYCEWAEQSEREVDDRPSFEIYLNSPMDTPPEKLRTEIFVPLK